MAVYKAVLQNEIRAAFIEVEPSLRRLSQSPFIHWHPVDVFMSLHSGVSNMFWLYEGAEKTGFVILTPDDESVELWIGAGLNGHVFDLAECADSLFSLAKDFGFKRITFKSHRRGWERVAQRVGWTPVMVEYEREL